MEIERELVPRSTIEDFARKHGLVMKVVERPYNMGVGMLGEFRFYAHFKNAEVKDGAMLRGASGDGPTEQDAISRYRANISEQRIVVDAMGPNRREIDVPRLTVS